MDKWLLLKKMDEAGITQSDLAKKAGMARNTLSRKINGQSSFYPYEINNICNVLKITDDSDKVDIFLS